MNQPELYTYSGGDNLTRNLADRVFAPVCLLDHKYYLAEYPAFYFIVRKDLNDNAPENERVCLYREGVVNRHLHGHDLPATAWMSNEHRCNRRIEVIYRDMLEKVELLNITK